MSILARVARSRSTRHIDLAPETATDLADCCVAHTQLVGLRELRTAITAKRLVSGMAPFDRFIIPAEWATTYPATAKDVPSAESYSAETAALLVARMVDAALLS